MTAREVASLVIAQANAMGQMPERLFIPDIAKEIPLVIRDIVTNIAAMGTKEERKAFQKDFALALTAVTDDYDTVDLTGAIGSTLLASAMYVSLPFPGVTHVDLPEGEELIYVSDKRSLLYTDLGYVGYYSVVGALMYIKADPELSNPSNVVITSFFFPSIAEYPRQYADELVTRLLQRFGVVKAMKK